MEEWVGTAWDRLVRRQAGRSHPGAVVRLAAMERMIAVYFHALGGETGVRIAPAAPRPLPVHRRIVERMAGVGERRVLPALDAQALRLPAELDVFPDTALNRDLYLWLAALAAQAREESLAAGDGSAERWLCLNQDATLRVLQQWPGLRQRYERLVVAALALRTQPSALPKHLAAQEIAVRQSLLHPGSVRQWPGSSRPGDAMVEPVPLWLHSPQEMPEAAARSAEPPAPRAPAAKNDAQPATAVAAEPARTADNRSPFVLPFRAESLLLWADFIRVNRPVEEDDGADSRRIADSVDRLALAQGGQRVAARVKFDLDLPSAAEDDLPLGPGHRLPEWDYRRRVLVPDWCRVQPLLARHSVPTPLPPRLRSTARRLRAQLASLAPARRWRNAEQDGSEPDIDACVRAAADRAPGSPDASRGLYRAQTRLDRDLSCLLLADLSLSTDAWISDTQRVIDVIRDSLMVFAEALSATGDPFAIYGFSSLKRSLVRFHDIKHFDEPLGADVRGRIDALRPGYYTRMGAALRESTRRLAPRRAAQRVLMLLSDGKPHDIDSYDGTYGVEDTRAAVLEARRAGVRPFCVTIDRDGAGYLDHVFGRDGYAVVRRPAELPSRLPMLYAQLSR